MRAGEQQSSIKKRQSVSGSTCDQAEPCGGCCCWAGCVVLLCDYLSLFCCTVFCVALVSSLLRFCVVLRSGLSQLHAHKVSGRSRHAIKRYKQKTYHHNQTRAYD